MIKLELTQQMLGAIVQILAKQPFEVVAPIISEINRQASAQTMPSQIRTDGAQSRNSGRADQPFEAHLLQANLEKDDSQAEQEAAGSGDPGFELKRMQQPGGSCKDDNE